MALQRRFFNNRFVPVGTKAGSGAISKHFIYRDRMPQAHGRLTELKHRILYVKESVIKRGIRVDRWIHIYFKQLCGKRTLISL